MNIKNITINTLKIPLMQPYKSALRTVNYIEDIVVMITTTNGMVGYGSATGTPNITGETLESIVKVISTHIAPTLINKHLIGFNELLNIVQWIKLIQFV